MKKQIKFLVILFGILISIPSRAQNRVGFTGVSIPLSVEKEAGLGFEVSTFKNNPGIGFSVEYIPPAKLNYPSFTSVKALLLWEVTESFFIKTALGGLQEQTTGYIKTSYFLIGVGPQFTLDQFYISIYANLGVENKGFFPSSVSFVLGGKFK